MPDITMCANHVCPTKDTCYRHEATADSVQSYAHFTFKGDGSCEHYLDMGEYGEKGYKKATKESQREAGRETPGEKGL